MPNPAPADGLSYKIFAIALSLLTGAVGMFLPVFTGPKLYEAWINVFWGSIYGLGFLLVEQVGHFNPGPTAFALTIFGMVIWPLTVIFALYKGFLILFMRQRRWVVVVALLLLVVSLTYNVSIGSVRGTYVERMPIFSAFMDI